MERINRLDKLLSLTARLETFSEDLSLGNVRISFAIMPSLHMSNTLYVRSDTIINTHGTGHVRNQLKLKKFYFDRFSKTFIN